MAPNTKIDYQAEYIGFQGELKSFIFRLVTNRQDAEDIAQETYLKAFAKIEDFQGRSSFKTWIFAIAVNLAKNLLNKQSRWQVDAQDVSANLHMRHPNLMEKVTQRFHSEPNAEFEIREHIDYCFTCITKTLDLPQQVCLLLKEVYGFKQWEIMKITDLSEGKVKHGIADARQNMQRIFHKRCALINKKGVCHQCTALKGALNPDQDAHIRAREVKLARQAPDADPERLLDIRLDLVRSIDPLQQSGGQLHLHFLENIPRWVKMASLENS